MTADTTLDREPAIDERRAQYEAAVTCALLEETPAERDERLELVRVASRMTLHALLVDEESSPN